MEEYNDKNNKDMELLLLLSWLPSTQALETFPAPAAGMTRGIPPRGLHPGSARPKHHIAPRMSAAQHRIETMNLIRPLAFGLMAVGLAACSTNTPETTSVAPAPQSLDPSSVAYFNAEVGDRVFFGTDLSTLDVEAQSTLRRQAAWLLDNPTRTAVIEGHADEQGTREYNIALGARRAGKLQRARKIGERRGLVAALLFQHAAPAQ